MRYLCILSHDVPGTEPGKYKVYEAGREYDLEEAEPGYFRAVYDATEAENRVSVDAGKRKSGKADSH